MAFRRILFCLLYLLSFPCLGSSSGTFFDSSITLTSNDSAGIAQGTSANLSVTVRDVGTASGSDSANIDIPSQFTVNSTTCGATVMQQGAYTLVSWNNIALAAGQQRSCSISVKLTTLPNPGTALTAFGTLAGGGTSPDNNTDSHTFNIIYTPISDVSVTLSTPNTTALPGSQFTVTLTVANDGPSNAPNVVAAVTTPTTIRLDKATCVSGTLPNPFSWNAATVNAKANKTCALTYSVLTQTAPSAVISVRVTSGATDNTNGNNSDSLTMNLVSYSGVKLDIDTDTPGPVKVGDVITYRLTFRNNGGASVVSGSVVNVLPPETSFQASSCGTNGSSGFFWTLPGLNGGVGASATCTFTATVTSLPANYILHDTAAANFVLGTSFNGSALASQDIGTIRPAAPLAHTLSGAPTTQASLHPSLSADGKVVVFSSVESGYLSSDNNTVGPDVYLLDKRTGSVKRVNVSDTTGAQLVGSADRPVISGNALALAFLYNPGATTSANFGAGKAGLIEASSTTICVAPPNGLFKPQCLTGTNGQPVNGSAENPSLSADGRVMAFCSAASNIPGTVDTNGAKDVFVLDQVLGLVTLVSTTADGTAGNGESCEAMISGDGKSVVFSSKAANFGTNGVNRQVFRKDLASNALTLISKGVDGNPANTDAGTPTISYDGQRITFASRATNLVTGVGTTANKIWVYDETGAITTSNKVDVVRGTGGVLPNLDSEAPMISCNGRIVAFDTMATNLAGSDTNGKSDIYLYDVDTKVVRRAVAPQAGVEPNGGSSEPVLDCEGNTMAFESSATNLNSGDPNSNDDIYGQDNPLRADASAVTVDGSFSGNWYNPGNDGHGFLIEALSLPGTPFYVTWYVFQNGQPVFLQGVANAVGNTLTVDMTTAKSTGFPAGAGGATATPWGKVKLTFTDANNGLAEWTPTAAGYTAGSFTIRRLTTPALIQSDTNQTLRACYSGIWSDAAKPGYGIDLEVNDFDAATRLLTVYWYTYQPNGIPLWLVGTGAAASGKVTLDLYQVSGGGAQFPPAYAKAGTAATKWGSATVTFTGSNALSFAWTPTAAGYAAGSGNLTRLTSLTTRTCQ